MEQDHCEKDKLVKTNRRNQNIVQTKSSMVARQEANSSSTQGVCHGTDKTKWMKQETNGDWSAPGSDKAKMGPLGCPGRRLVLRTSPGRRPMAKTSILCRATGKTSTFLRATS